MALDKRLNKRFLLKCYDLSNYKIPVHRRVSISVRNTYAVTRPVSLGKNFDTARAYEFPQHLPGQPHISKNGSTAWDKVEPIHFICMQLPTRKVPFHMLIASFFGQGLVLHSCRSVSSVDATEEAICCLFEFNSVKAPRFQDLPPCVRLQVPISGLAPGEDRVCLFTFFVASILESFLAPQLQIAWHDLQYRKLFYPTTRLTGLWVQAHLSDKVTNSVN